MSIWEDSPPALPIREGAVSCAKRVADGIAKQMMNKSLIFFLMRMFFISNCSLPYREGGGRVLL
jgi:hypothetical protein